MTDTRDEAVAHPLSCLPDCMMPDGADPCAGYQTLDRAYDAERQKVATLTRQLAEAQGMIEQMREALEPFAEVADDFDREGRTLRDEDGIYANFAGDFRRAREALAHTAAMGAKDD